MNSRLRIFYPSVAPSLNFSNSNEWTLGVGWTFSGGVASYDGTSPSVSFLQFDGLVSGRRYRLRIGFSVSPSDVDVDRGDGTTFTQSVSSSLVDVEFTATGSLFGVASSDESEQASLTWIKVEPVPGVAELDLKDDLPIPITYSIADVRNPDKRQQTFSKTVQLPATANNSRVLGHLYEIGGDGSFDPRRKVRAVLETDGNTVLDGSLRLLSVNRRQDGFGSEYDFVGYEASLVSSVTDLFLSVGEKKLSDLDWSEFNHSLNVSTVLATGLGGPGSDFIYVNGATVNNWTAGASKTITVVDAHSDAYGARVKITTSTAHGFQPGDQVWIAGSQMEQLRLAGYNTVREIISTTVAVLNTHYGSLLLSAVVGGVSGGQTVQEYTPTGQGYCYPWIDYGNGLDPTINPYVSKLRPAIYLRQYLNKIFQSAGFEWDSDFLDSDYFRRMIVPFNGDKLSVDVATAALRTARAALSADQEVTYNLFWNGLDFVQLQNQISPNNGYSHEGNGSIQLQFDDESTAPNGDPGSNYNNTLFEYTVPTGGTGKYKVATEGLFEHYVVTGGTYPLTDGYPTGYDGDGVQVPGILSCFNGPKKVDTFFQIFKNGSLVAQSSDFTGDTWTSAPKFYTYAATLELTEGDTVEIRLKTSARALVFNGTSPLLLPVFVTARVKEGSACSFSYVDDEVAYNSPIEGSSMVLRDTKCKDLLTDVIKLFNLHLMPKPGFERTLVIEPRDEFYDYSGGPIDWTDMLGVSREFTITPLGELSSKAFRYEYAEDSDDVNERYQEKFKETYGSAQTNVVNDFSSETLTTKVGFAATPLCGPSVYYTASGNDAVISRIRKTEGTLASKPRLLFWTPRSGSKPRTLLNDSGASLGTILMYGYAGHLDRFDGPLYDLNWDNAQEFYYDYPGLTDNGLFNTYHATGVREISDRRSKVVSCYMRLTPSVMSQVDFRKLILVDGHLFRLNKIADYNPLSDGLTKVELVLALEPGKLRGQGISVLGERPVRKAPTPVTVMTSEAAVSEYDSENNVLKIGSEAQVGPSSPEPQNLIVIGGSPNDNVTESDAVVILGQLVLPNVVQALGDADAASKGVPIGGLYAKGNEPYIRET